MSRNIDRHVRVLRDQLARMEVPRGIAETFAEYQPDPVRFAAEVLGVERLPAYQEGFLRDVAKHELNAWVAGHAVGKSHAAAILLAWYLVTRPGCRCVVTSATFERQVGRVILAKLATLVAQSRVPLPIEVGVTRAHVKGHLEWGVEGVPASKPGNFAGLHAPHMLVIADEAKALDRSVFEELHGVLASASEEARLVLLSTAGPAQGYFYDCFVRGADRWCLRRTPSTESPFAEGFAERMRQECLGVEDPVFKMRVLAEFASDVEGQLIPIAAIHAAIGREFEDDEEDGRLVLGVDIARFGEDRTVIAVAQGRRLCETIGWRGLDTMATADRIASEINARSPSRVLIDEIGIGAGVVDRLRQLGHEVEAVNVGTASSDPNLFLNLNLRAEIGWRVRERFERGEVAITDDPALVSELAAMRYTYDPRGRIKLEAKDQAKTRLGRSPDLAAAAMLAMHGSSADHVSGWCYLGGEIVNILTGEVWKNQLDW